MYVHMYVCMYVCMYVRMYVRMYVCMYDRVVGIATRYWLYGPGIEFLSIPVAKRSKARVCGRFLAGVASSNPAGGLDICVVCCK